jgi:hypothetical protein
VLGVVAAALVTALAAVLAGWLQLLPSIGSARQDPAPVTASPTVRPTPRSPATGTPDPPPLTLAVHQLQSHCGTTWFVPSPAANIDFADPPPPTPGDPDPPDLATWPAYPASAGGSPAAPASVYVTVQGSSEVAVVLTGIEVMVTRRQQTPEGTLLDDPCGGPAEYRWLAVDLDQDPPRISRVLDEDTLEFRQEREEIPPERRQPIQFPYTVSTSDPETFLISARTADCLCDWVGVLRWQSAGRTGTITIDNDGEPFRTAGVDRVAITCFATGECRDR